MEDKLIILENKMNKLEERYPNLIQMWKKYIQVKRKSLVNGIKECEKALDTIVENIENDLSKDAISLLYLLNNTI